MTTRVPNLWLGETIVCLGTGPSLTLEDVGFVRDRARVIAVNDAYRWAPWADVLYACDEKWWKWQFRERPKMIAGFTGLKFALQGHPSRWVPGVQVLKNTGEQGLEHEATGLRNGRNSGYQAINLAVHLGAAKIVLLGYDMGYGEKGATHFFGAHPDRTKPPFTSCRRNFPTLVEPLHSLQIEIVNCSRATTLKCFRRSTLASTIRSEIAA